MEYLNKTRWIVKFNDNENKQIRNKRVLIEYFPLKNKFVFTGQLKVGDYQIDFSRKKIVLGSLKKIGEDVLGDDITEIITIDNINIDENILMVYTELEERINNYNKFSEMMIDYKDIKISYEDADNKEIN